MFFFKDFSLSAVVAGFVTALVGFTSSTVIVIQAAKALGATPDQVGSWMWALGLGMGLTAITLSLRYRVPISIAWSTPGAAMLVTTVGVSMPEAIGAFMLSAFLLALFGFTGWFDSIMRRLPASLAAAMLAGVLLRFGMDAFLAMKHAFWLVGPMFCAYILARRWRPRYAVMLALAVGIGLTAWMGELRLGGVPLELMRPVFVAPEFSLHALIGVGLPLFLVTMASQNMPGVAALRVSGYQTPVSPLIGWAGISNLALAPFGAFALNLSAISASICMGREVHEDPAKRYVAAVTAGALYALVGLFGGAVGALFAALPQALVLAIAGFALLGTIGTGLAAALVNEDEREPALVTMLVTASGLSLAGIGSAFWGLVAGMAVLLVLRAGQRK